MNICEFTIDEMKSLIAEGDMKIDRLKKLWHKEHKAYRRQAVLDELEKAIKEKWIEKHNLELQKEWTPAGWKKPIQLWVDQVNMEYKFHVFVPSDGPEINWTAHQNAWDAEDWVQENYLHEKEQQELSF